MGKHSGRGPKVEEDDPHEMKGLKFCQYVLSKLGEETEAFESEEVARIASFVMKDLELDIDDPTDFIKKCGSDIYGSPEVLVKLMEDDVADFKPLDVFNLLLDAAEDSGQQHCGQFPWQFGP